MSNTDHLSENHRNTLYHLERHPTTHNLEWHDLLSLLKEVADVTEEHDGKVKVRLDDRGLVLSPPRHKDIDEDLLTSVRKLLRDAGYFTAEK